MTYHVDRFYAAVATLAGDGHIKQRLIRAYQDNLAEIEDDDLPVDLKEPFADLKKRMYCVAPLNGEGPVKASVRKMSVTEASDCSKSIVSLYSEVLKRADDIQEPLPLDTEEPRVPPFLVKSVS